MPTEQHASFNIEKTFFSDELILQLGMRLVKNKYLTSDQLDELNSRAALTGARLDRLIIKEAIIPEEKVLRTISELTNIPFKHMSELNISHAAVNKVQPKIALRYDVMPISLVDGVLTLAVNEVPPITSVDSIRMLVDSGLDWILCTENDISKSLKHFYGLGADTLDQLPDTETDTDSGIRETDLSVEDADEGIIRFVNQVISEAIRMNATDIHMEPFENHLRLRYRIDGILQDIPVPEKIRIYRKAIVSCCKIMADMNIAERRKPHDGRIQVRNGADEFDLRVSILPTRFGETVNMRILNRKSMFINLEHLGLTKQQQPYLEQLAALPHGVILLTGPTGSGKTTTLYAVLSKINSSDDKIITVEDPVEYQIQGITQIQANAQIGLTFASILRSILRHDPDIILIGEIRDGETADIAVRASLTGHLVFSTLHTNDAPSAVTRLIDMDIEPYLVSSCLEGVIAQRLVRRLCPACKMEHQPKEAIISEIQESYPKELEAAVFYNSRGCPECNFTGYRGRLALFEIMLLDDEIRNMIVHLRPSTEIKHKAVSKGLVTLRKDGWMKVLAGLTTVDEVVRMTRRDEVQYKKES